MCITKAYTIMLIKAQVSLGSQPQYLPQLSLAHMPPRKFPIANITKPTVKAISLIMVSSLMLMSMRSLFSSLVRIINNKVTTPKIMPIAKGP